MRDRYEPILCIDESWMVFDLKTGEPAQQGDRILIGLSAGECGRLLRQLNDDGGASEAEPTGVGPWTN